MKEDAQFIRNSKKPEEKATTYEAVQTVSICVCVCLNLRISQMWGGTQTDSVQFNWFNLNFPTELQFFSWFSISCASFKQADAIPYFHLCVCLRVSEQARAWIPFYRVSGKKVVAFSQFICCYFCIYFFRFFLFCRLVNRFLLIGVFIFSLFFCFGSKERWMARKVRKSLSTIAQTQD